MKGNNGTIVVFMCNHCPYVVHLLDEFVALAKKNIAHGIPTIAISSNDVENYPDDHPDKMKQLSNSKKFSFPYLYDEDQSVLKPMKPHVLQIFICWIKKMFLCTEVVLTPRPGNESTITGEDLQLAIDQLLKKEPIPAHQVPSMGCNINGKQGMNLLDFLFKVNQFYFKFKGSIGRNYAPSSGRTISQIRRYD